jgi:hypothetical protein
MSVDMNTPLATNLRFFSLAKANSALVLVHPIVAEIMQRHKRLVQIQSEIEEVERRLPGISERDSRLYDQISDDLYDEMNAVLGHVTHNVEELQAIGCIFKDFLVGIVDFPAHFAGRDVYLCWQFGEKEISNWHEMEEGFNGRNAIDTHFQTDSPGAETILA